MNVFVGVEELELACVELSLDPPKTTLDGRQLRGRKEFRGSETACVREAPGDVEGVQLEISVERR